MIKHLSKVGLRVSFEQKYLQEFDYTVANLAVDLRDGLRLARVAEIMLARMEEGEGGIDQNMLVSNQLRVPAVSRLQKVFNVKTALSYLAHLGIDLNYTTTEIIRDVDICDGHRHKTLVCC